MTKLEFIEEAKRRGLSKEETRRQFELLEAQGAFSDSANPRPADPKSLLGSNLGAAVTGFMDPIYGASQVLYNTANDLGVAGPLKALDAAAYDATGGLFGSPGGDVNQQIKDREIKFQMANGGSGGVPRFLGNMAGALLTRQPTSTAGMLGTGAAFGASVPQTNTDGYWGNVATNSALGAAAGWAIPQALDATGRGIRAGINRPEVQRLREMGVTPTVGQAVGGIANKMEQMAMSFPILGDVIRGARQRSFDEWNNAQINAAIYPVRQRFPYADEPDPPGTGVLRLTGSGSNVPAVRGETPASTAVGPVRGIDDAIGVNGAADVTEEYIEPGLQRFAPVSGTGSDAVSQAQSIVSKAYDEALDIVPGFRLSQEGAKEFASLRELVDTGAIAKESRDTINRFFTSRIQPRLGEGGITSATWKQLDSELNEAIATTGNVEVKAALQEIQNILWREAARHSKDFKVAMDNADKAYANLVRIEGAANRSLANDGVFSPAQLMMAIRGADTSARRRQTAAGKGPMMEDARAAQAVIPNREPSSGTAERLASMMFMGASLPGMFVNPLAAASLPLAGAIGYAGSSPAAQRVLTQGAGMLAPGIRAAGKLPWRGVPYLYDEREGY